VTATAAMAVTAAGPQAARALSARFPARPVAASWPATRQDRAGAMELVNQASSAVPEPGSAERTRCQGLPVLLDWLEEQPGRTWQERWLASGADAAREDWVAGPTGWLRRHGRFSAWQLELMTGSLLTLVGADLVRPSLGWLLTGARLRKLGPRMARLRDPAGFARLRRVCEDDPGITAGAGAMVQFRLAVIAAAKGGMLADVTVGDVLEVMEAERPLRAKQHAGPATFQVLQQMGIFGPGVPALREIRSPGQRTAEELVDRYPVACRPVRDLIVSYLKERQPAVDYSTLVALSYQLVRCFWADLERHHPGIGSLRLPGEVAAAWKQRLRTRTTTITAVTGEKIVAEAERLNYLDTLATVRGFYLDLAEWALHDPARWGLWVAPCPVTPAEVQRRKHLRRRKARMDARTRDRLAVLPALVRSAARWRDDSQALLAAARQARPGQEFTAAGQALVRSGRPQAAPGSIWAQDPATGRQRLLNREEEHAFWAWAIIEVLRLTGIRVEELLELSHHSLVQYRLPGTGELVPLLQIAPSKTDAERLLVVSPELADVLSAIICRVRGSHGAVPLVRARDWHERTWLPPSPLLFQRRVSSENRAVTTTHVARLLNAALARSGLTDPATGGPLYCTPHDFRRMFITDAVQNGLPPHIAQVIAGHQDISVTMGYKAVYPEEAIRSHLAFLARRRSLRPTEEYRIPTDEEWAEFLGHFERRKVAVGTCGRAFGTPCIHEHACIRCPMLWPDPAQRDRLVEIHDNLTARIAEARREGWAGEVEGLQVSLAGAEDKLAHIDRRACRPATGLGIPQVRTGAPVQRDEVVSLD